MTLFSIFSVRADAEVQEEAAPPPPPPKKSSGKKSLDALSPAELEELKNEVVAELVEKVAGENGEKLEGLLEPELITAPYDPRFPNRNQARHCFVRFNEYYKCIYERGEEHPRCKFYHNAYMSLCPSEWVESWQELREKGLWTGKY
ncbi:hypothetical protein HYH03_005073 [Edaphochlamys debaryana]|uniref:Uncharacterized protein n=1 Tax=Edaphochlamys debaryana TaxID=47281 RepID=A0A835Y971_9CHLO|nr:hypothetical protein HYH03_005073 [Edaphochlamys debaryana]|eukprot:KAG2497078.1 hypothetical protein HYH03_005073 [Edaphochlamys debaryana]